MNKPKIWKIILIVFVVYFANSALWGILNLYPQAIYSSPAFLGPVISFSAFFASMIFSGLFSILNLCFLVTCFFTKSVKKIIILIPLLYLVGEKIPGIIASILTGSFTVTSAWDDIALRIQLIFSDMILPIILLLLSIFFLHKNRFWKKQEILDKLL
ncbi:MAG: hypothetical protein RL641_219 [Candidatus Parcubacteria bacterium]|jgi:hypothetical protein